MANITRHEIVELVAKFKKKFVPAALPVGSGDFYGYHLGRISRDLENAKGSPDVRLRNVGRVLKHFLSDYKGDVKEGMVFFNHVCNEVTRGEDPTTAIKRARSKIKVADVVTELNQAMAKAAKQSVEESQHCFQLVSLPLYGNANGLGRLLREQLSA